MYNFVNRTSPWSKAGRSCGVKQASALVKYAAKHCREHRHYTKATKDAAKIAGLDVLKFLNEPTAAALAHGLSRRELNRTDR